MRKNQNGFVYILLVVVIVAFGIGALAYFAYKNGQININSNNNDKSSSYRKEETSGSITRTESRSYYDEHTRIITSPELERPNGNKFKYSLYLPLDWSVEKIFDSENPINIVIVKNNHKLDINSVWLSSECIFPGEKLPESQYEHLVQYKNLNTKFGPARVGRNDISTYTDNGYIIFRFCQLETNSNDKSVKQWMSATKLGIIEYRVPLKYDENIIQEMDTIVSSISYTEL